MTSAASANGIRAAAAPSLRRRVLPRGYVAICLRLVVGVEQEYWIRRFNSEQMAEKQGQLWHLSISRSVFGNTWIVDKARGCARMDGEKVNRPDDRRGQSLWAFIRTESGVLLAAYVATVLFSGLVMFAWTPIVVWFGFIYLIAAVISILAVGYFVHRGDMRSGKWMSMVWLVLASLIALGLTVLYAATIVPLYSGTRISQLVEIQLFHSVYSTMAVVIVGGLWHFWLWRKDSRRKPAIHSQA